MRIAKARLISPDHNFWYGLIGCCRFDLRVRLFDTVREGLGACLLRAVAAARSRRLSPHARQLREILLDHRFRDICLPVGFLVGGPWRHAARRPAAGIAPGLRADRRPHRQHQDPDARHPHRRHAGPVLFAGFRRLSLRSVRRQLQLRRRFCLEEPARAVRLARHLLRLCLHLHSARTRRLAHAGRPLRRAVRIRACRLAVGRLDHRDGRHAGRHRRPRRDPPVFAARSQSRPAGRHGACRRQSSWSG